MLLRRKIDEAAMPRKRGKSPKKPLKADIQEAIYA
jgi:hypothetical protein